MTAAAEADGPVIFLLLLHFQLCLMMPVTCKWMLFYRLQNFLHFSWFLCQNDMLQIKGPSDFAVCPSLSSSVQVCVCMSAGSGCGKCEEDSRYKNNQHTVYEFESCWRWLKNEQKKAGETISLFLNTFCSRKYE